MNDLRSQKTPIESLFIEATERFRSNIKTMYSVPVRGPHPTAHTSPPPVPLHNPFSGSWGHLVMFLQNGKIHVGYKDLMENYQIVVNNLAAERGEKDTNLVLNVFQSLLDEFTRSYTKTDFEPTKVGSFTPTAPILSWVLPVQWLAVSPHIVLAQPLPFSHTHLSPASPTTLVDPHPLSPTNYGTIISLVSHGPDAALLSRLWVLGCLMLLQVGHGASKLPTSFLRTGMFLGDSWSDYSSPCGLHLSLSLSRAKPRRRSGNRNVL